jgi:hypothetical protein
MAHTVTSDAWRHLPLPVTQLAFQPQEHQLALGNSTWHVFAPAGNLGDFADEVIYANEPAEDGVAFYEGTLLKEVAASAGPFVILDRSGR